MRLADKYGDGRVTDPLSWKKHKSDWEAGARDSGKGPATMLVLVEQYVVVGGQAEAKEAAERWRFGPKAVKGNFNIPNPATIQEAAEKDIPIEQILDRWAIGTNPGTHISKIRAFHESGATLVNIHSRQSDQRRVVVFYGAKLIPQVNRT